jgi:hypothetical protein
MHKHVTAHYPDLASAEKAHADLTRANIYAHDIHIEEEADGRVAVRAYVQPEETERAVEILRGERDPNDTRGINASEAPRAGAMPGERSRMKGGPYETWSREDEVRPDGSGTKPRDYDGSEEQASDPGKVVR